MAYGIEIFNSSGTKIIELSSRVDRFVQAGTLTTSGGTATVTVTGMANNDSWVVLRALNQGLSIGSTVTKTTNSFTLTQQSAVSGTTDTTARTWNYWVVRT